MKLYFRKKYIFAAVADEITDTACQGCSLKLYEPVKREHGCSCGRVLVGVLVDVSCPRSTNTVDRVAPALVTCSSVLSGRYVPRAVLMDLVSQSRPVVVLLLAHVSFSHLGHCKAGQGA